MRWRAWYADRAYDSKATAWSDLPADGLQVAIEYHEDGTRTIFDGGDWYWLEGGHLHSVPSGAEWGTWQEPPDVSCLSCIKRGTRLDDAAYLAIADLAKAAHAP